VAQTEGGPIQPKDAIKINVGATFSAYNANVAMITRPNAAYTKLSYRVFKSAANNSKISDALKQKPNFLNHVEKTIDKS